MSYQGKKNTEYMRAYRSRNREKLRTYNREYNRLWRKKFGYQNEDKWKKKNHIKVRAERLLQYAIGVGILKRLPCQICGKEKSVAHHPDYKKALEVVFLCHQHHREIHYGNNPHPKNNTKIIL